VDRFGQDRGAKAESAFDDAGLTANVIGDIEGRCLAFTERAHHLEALERRIGWAVSNSGRNRAELLWPACAAHEACDASLQHAASVL
jgi:hypothetical protein